VKVRQLPRILDANANRAREGVRTAEDYIRFAVGHGRWAQQLREIRHRVTEVVQTYCSPESLLSAREVAGDPGHPARNEPEAAGSGNGREVPRDTAVRGLKRAQEAVRVLEEYLRDGNPGSSRILSQARYALYEAEQWLVLGSDQARRIAKANLCVLVTEAQCPLGWEATARAALAGGAGVLQLREKTLDGAVYAERAKRLRELCEEHDAALIVNDRADVAWAAGAAGVHLGQTDLAPEAVRHWAGERLQIGRSTHSLEEAQRAVEQEGADYIGIGAVYPTATKPGSERVLPALVQEVLARGWPVPVFAIGGITADRARELRGLGVRQVAVCAAVTSATDPARAAREICETLKA
jgi:thiamine-phosphate pyrophosphorylase